MQTDHLIPANHFCVQHNIESSFISMLHENGLVEIQMMEETQFIPEESLPEIEKIMRLHYELNINLEGIEAIMHLLHRIEYLQGELITLKNRLKMYESGDTISH